jgi:hypothetical protein
VPRLTYVYPTILYLYLTAFLIQFFVNGDLFAQTTDTLHRELTVDFELRPRIEYRDNFKWTTADTVMPDLYTTQRNRLSITYSTNRLRLYASPQEIHVWDDAGRPSYVGSVNFFELYAEPIIAKNFSVRVGRQALSLDNGRIFSSAPWSQQSRAHEGIRLFYKKKLEMDLTLAFTRPYGQHFKPAYSPVGSHTHKFLFVHHLKHKFSNSITVTTINAIDVFQRTTRNRQYYQRITNGGRLEYSHGSIYGTVNAYYQYGQNAASEKLRAYYIQPEVSVNTKKTLFRLGAEILSGQKNTSSKEISNSFVPLYGVAWKFMGNMNLFTRFPADVNEKGLVNPYLFIIYQASKKFFLRSDTHLFYSQYPLINEGKKVDGKYLGFESDLSLNYKPVKGIEIIYGFSFTIADKRMELLNKVPDAGKIPVWSFLMVSFTPRLLSRKWFRIQ